MLRRASGIAPLLTFTIACSQDAESLRFTATVSPELAASAARYEARFFDDRRCEDLALSRGRPDVARTATPAIVREAAAPDAFEPVVLAGFPGTVALELRALAESGTPLARRCVPVDSTVEETAAVLAVFAPAGATAMLTSDTAISSGTARRDLEVRVAGSDGEPVGGVFVSSGAHRPLAQTDEHGLARVRTPTDTPGYYGELELEVYGVPGVLPAFASALPVPSCPSVVWTRAIVEGVTGSRAEITEHLGLVYLARQRSATTAAGLLETFQVPSSSFMLQPVASATIAAPGIVAAETGRVAVAISESRVAILDVDSGRPSNVRHADVPSRAGAQPLLHALALRSGSLLAAGEGLPSGAVRFDRPGAPAEPFFEMGARDVFSLLSGELDDPVLIAGSEGLELWSGSGDAQLAALPGLFGTLVPRRRDRPWPERFLLLANDGRVLELRFQDGALTIGAESTLPFTTSVAAPGELNGDGREDLLAFGQGKLLLLTGDGRGRYLAAKECPLAGGLSRLLPLAPTADGRARWIAILETAGQLVVLGPEQ